MGLSNETLDVIIIAAAFAVVIVLLAIYYCYRRRNQRQILGGDRLINNDHLVPVASSDLKEPERQQYKIKKRLGDGAYGTVFLAVRRSDHAQVALKVIPCKDEEDAKNSMKEYTMCQAVQNHPNVVRVFDMFFDVPDRTSHLRNAPGGHGKNDVLKGLGIAAPAAEKYLIIVSEYCEEGTLFDVLVTLRNANLQGRNQSAGGLRVSGLSEGVVWQYTTQLLDALAFLHSKNLMHRDLKPSNVLLADNFKRVIYTDFGLSREVASEEYAQTRTGTLQYMSPEQIQRRYNNKSDVWGIGCLVHAMCTGKVSTSEARVMFRDRAKPNFATETLPKEMYGYSPALVEFMLLLLQVAYQERPTSAEALALCRQRAAEYEASKVAKEAPVRTE
jgi:probable inactive protein kinase-like protein SgK071